MNELKSILIAHLDGKNFSISVFLRFKGIYLHVLLQLEINKNHC